MNHQGNLNRVPIEHLVYLAQAFEIDLGVLGLVDPMRRPNGRSEDIDARALNKLNRLSRVTQLGFVFSDLDLVFDPRNGPHLTFR